ncbi:hypothetical protein WOLCODRAFT_156134 [Wolfiporia cocos MD-104 SS10]|uniref:Uncharacterized protein n=1 Tax=Wolfiporia cocos (strain MD-104) TaxID=742152 RepID=A0A2H3IZU2_WOLCO|nr:hypothetical protein WOLCODRAFT_156134 [Wolfiporia cocos MD-104 SS10]
MSLDASRSDFGLSSETVHSSDIIFALDVISVCTTNLIKELQHYTPPADSRALGTTIPFYRPIAYDMLGLSLSIAHRATWLSSVLLGDFHNADVKYPHDQHTSWEAARTTTAVLFQALGNVRCGLDKDGQGTMEDEIMISQGFCLHDLLPDPKKIPTAFPDKKITRRPPVPPPNNVTIFSKSAPDEDTTLIEDASTGHQTFSKCKRNITDDGDSMHADTKCVHRNV